MQENKSEVARLRQQIADSYSSAQRGLTGLAIVSRHDFIKARMDGIAQCHGELVKLVGPDQAIQMVFEIQVTVVK